jgi:2-aminoethylphosphonate dioxygenase
VREQDAQRVDGLGDRDAILEVEIEQVDARDTRVCEGIPKGGSVRVVDLALDVEGLLGESEGEVRHARWLSSPRDACVSAVNPTLWRDTPPPEVSMSERIQIIVDEILSILARSADAAYIGEPVSQLAHMLQGAHLAERAGADEAEILGVLLHDLGHLCAEPDAAQMDGLGVLNHEEIGAAFLEERGFGAVVCALVRCHVDAKRYLVTKNAHYRNSLSAASRGTLAFQGGPMSEAEAAAFEQDPLFSAILRVRTWDERGKDPGLDVPGLEHYAPMLARHLATRQHPLTLTPEQRQCWADNGFVTISGALSVEQTRRIQNWTAEISDWPESPGRWMKWFESTDAEPRMLCRLENFVPYHRGFAELLKGEMITGLISELMGESAILYKEKINFKLPGGSGYGAHQDAPAFATFGHRYHITMMVPIDAADPDNGCLEMVYGHHDRGLLRQNEAGEVHPEVEDSLQWRSLSSKPGDLVFFDSFVPHRSNANTSPRSRRAMYITYNRASEGDYRSSYFERKRRNFPPECERVEGVDYSAAAAVFNLGNPIR